MEKEILSSWNATWIRGSGGDLGEGADSTGKNSDIRVREVDGMQLGAQQVVETGPQRQLSVYITTAKTHPIRVA